MSFIDDISAFANDGVATVNKFGREVKLKARANSLLEKRNLLITRLGEALYDDMRDSSEYAGKFEDLYSAISEIDDEYGLIMNELLAQNPTSDIKSTGTAPTRRQGSQTAGGYEVRDGLSDSLHEADDGDMAMAALECPACGAPISDDDSFCMNCGLRLSD